ncbi:MAG: tRNA 2-selenouridine synthase, partial [Yoonia sp.]
KSRKIDERRVIGEVSVDALDDAGQERAADGIVAALKSL